MQYPPHKSPAIVNRYYPVFRTALDKFPEPYWFKPHPEVNFNTTVSRLRDTRKALLDYIYPGIRLTLDERENLDQFIVSVKTDYIGIGTRSVLRDMGPVLEETTTTNERQLPLGNNKSQAVLDAACVLLLNGYFDGVTINSNCGLVLPEVPIEHTQIGKEILFYVG